MKLDFNFVKACKDTKVELDGVINALGGTYPPIPPSNPKTVVTYQNGDIVEYEIEGELGSNSIPDKTNAVKAEIGTAVTSIGIEAFYYCSNLTSVTIPNSVTNIWYEAFAYCYKLTFVTIPDSVTKIMPATFAGCSSLTSITIPTQVTSIGDRAFESCSSLTSITIPDSVTNIGNYAFRGCIRMTSITIGNGMTNIGKMAFYYCPALSSITCLATSAPTIEYDAFGDSDSNYTGRNTYSTGNNVLKVLQGATRYDYEAWFDPLQNSTRCGFRIEYI